MADLTSTAQEPTTTSSATLETFTMQRVATLSDYYPVGVADLPAFRGLIDTTCPNRSVRDRIATS
ncbi:MAG TPA: hypothetical protein VLA82_02355 [Actinomycetota bacterium]|nr:hypothetical protein [Actinomycetota bacterium]